MRRLIVILAVGLAAALPAAGISAPASSDSKVMCKLTAKLLASEEVPPTNSMASGITKLKILQNGTIKFATKIDNPGQETFNAGHIHQAPRGMNGPIVQPIFVGGPTNAMKIKQKGSVSNPGLAQMLCSNPSGFYVNYHSVEHSSGAIRGQLG